MKIFFLILYDIPYELSHCVMEIVVYLYLIYVSTIDRTKQYIVYPDERKINFSNFAFKFTVVTFILRLLGKV